MVRKTDLLNRKACKLPLFSSFCGGLVITLAGIWEPHGGFPRHGHRDTHHPPQHTRPPHTHLLTHSHTHTLSLSLSLTHTHTHTLAPTPTLTPLSRRLQPGPDDPVQALDGQGGRRPLVDRPAARLQPDRAWTGPGVKCLLRGGE